jgi:hypothetical protein
MITILLINIIISVLILATTTAIVVLHFKEVKELKKEISLLEKSRDYHINELKKRSGVQNEDLH